MDSAITDKEKLDLAWNYFQQHAQQRLNYFNFFIIFSGLMTNAYIATLQEKFLFPWIGIIIGLIQVFISYIFLKIDQRNKFLTKHSENVIISIESRNNITNDSENIDEITLFTSEEGKTKEKKKNEHFLFRQISHGDSFKIIYFTFILLGLASSIWTIFNNTKISESTTKQEIIKIDTLKLDIIKIDTLNNNITIPHEKIDTSITKPNQQPHK